MGAPYRRKIYLTDDTKYQGIARALREARKRAMLTQDELATKLGIGRVRLAQWETASRNIPITEIPKIQKLLPAARDWKIDARWSPHPGRGMRVAVLREGT